MKTNIVHIITYDTYNNICFKHCFNIFGPTFYRFFSKVEKTRQVSEYNALFEARIRRQKAKIHTLYYLRTSSNNIFLSINKTKKFLDKTFVYNGQNSS